MDRWSLPHSNYFPVPSCHFLYPSTITPNSLLLSEQPNTRVPRCLGLHDIIRAFSTVVPERYPTLLCYEEHIRQIFVDPLYLPSEFAFYGVVLGVNRGLFSTETSNAKGRCGDHDDVNGCEIGTCGVGACFGDFEFLYVSAPCMDVANAQAHLDC